MKNIRNINILFSYHTNPYSMPPVNLSDNQVLCGPFCEDVYVDNMVYSLNTTKGSYDINPVIEKIPKGQKPELLIIKADSTRNNFPAKLNLLEIPKVLIIGDTHHLQQPIRTMLDYALKEEFDYYVSDHKRHHLHYFIEAGLSNCYWLPGFLVKDWQLEFKENRDTPLSFVGQANQFHPMRKRMLAKIKAAGLPIQTNSVSQEEASQIYSNSLLSLNHSLNGDLNLRVFEVLAAGGCLVTDRLSPQSGLEELFQNKKHLVLFDNFEDLIKKLEYYLSNPNEALEIARKGYQEFHSHHHPEIKTKQLMDLVFNNTIDDCYKSTSDKRSLAVKSSSLEDLKTRISQYEYLQDLHRQYSELTVLFHPSADERLLCDIADLPRLRIHSLKPTGTLVEETGVRDQIYTIDQEQLSASKIKWDLLITGTNLILDQNQQLNLNHPPANILFTDWPKIRDHEIKTQVQNSIYRMGYKLLNISVSGIFGGK